MPCRVIKSLKDIQGSRLIAAIPGAVGGARVFPARQDYWGLLTRWRQRDGGRRGEARQEWPSFLCLQERGGPSCGRHCLECLHGNHASPRLALAAALYLVPPEPWVLEAQ